MYINSFAFQLNTKRTMSENWLYNIISYEENSDEDTQEFVLCNEIIDKDQLSDNEEHVIPRVQVLDSNLELLTDVVCEEDCFENDEDSQFIEYSVEQTEDEDINYPQVKEEFLANDEQLEQQWKALNDENRNDDNNNGNYELIEFDEEEIIQENHFEALPNNEVKPKKYKCFQCEYTFDDISEKAEHICAKFKNADDSYTENVELTEIVEYICPNCGMKFSTLSSYEDHAPACTNQFQCVHCSRIFSTLKGLSIHARVHLEKTKPVVHSEKRETGIMCDVCNTTFSSEKSLKLHVKIHEGRPKKTIEQALSSISKDEYTDMNLFHCEICDKSFDQKLLAVHKNMHLNVNNFTCNVCNRRFDTELTFNLHQKMHASKTTKERPQKGSKHLRNGRIFPCQYCDRVFPRPHEKVIHERVHTGEKPFSCEVCGKTFRVSYSLTLHLRTHTNIRPFVCEICKKRFKSQATYAHHMNTHNIECKYKCDICGKGYRTSVQLCMHKHTHNKPVNCTVCNRPFATLYAVKLHMKTHEHGTKSSENLKHYCKICGAAYARAFALTYHMTDQHNIAPKIANQLLEKSNTADNNADDDMLSDNSNEKFMESDGDEETKTATRQLTACLEQYNDEDNEDLSNEINEDNIRTEEIITDWPID